MTEEEKRSLSDEERLGYYTHVFQHLSDAAQRIFIMWMIALSPSVGSALMDVGECESPIEEILSAALSLWRWSAHDDLQIDIYPQFEIEANGHNYRADFYIYAWHLGSDKELDLVVECDGHKFHHATKEQVQHDNEREYDLKIEGMDVLRFSGAQIYNNPFKCAGDIVDYIKTKVEPDEE